DQPQLAVERIGLGLLRALGVAEAVEVDRDRPVALGELRGDLPPGVGRFAEAVEEEDRRARSALLDVDAPAVDLEHVRGRESAPDLRVGPERDAAHRAREGRAQAGEDSAGPRDSSRRSGGGSVRSLARHLDSPWDAAARQAAIRSRASRRWVWTRRMTRSPGRAIERARSTPASSSPACSTAATPRRRSSPARSAGTSPGARPRSIEGISLTIATSGEKRRAARARSRIARSSRSPAWPKRRIRRRAGKLATRLPRASKPCGLCA